MPPYQKSCITLFLIGLFLSNQKSSAQDCITTQFSKSYNFQWNVIPHFFNVLPHESFLFGGQKNYKLNIIKTNNDGDIIWSNEYNQAQTEVYADNGCGTLDSNNMCIAGMDANSVIIVDTFGNVINAKKLKIPQDNLVMLEIGVMQNNDKIFFADDQSTYAAEGYLLFRLSADLSTVLWTRHISAWQMFLTGMTISGNEILVSGRVNDIGTILKFDATTGNLIKQNKYNLDGLATHVSKVYPYNNGYLATSRNLINGNKIFSVTRLDKDLNILNSCYLEAIPENATISYTVDTDGSYYAAWATQAFGYWQLQVSQKDSILWHRLNSAISLTKAKTLYKTNSGLVLFSAGNYFNVATQTNESLFALSRSDANGNFLNCPSYDQPIKKTPISFQLYPPSVLARDTNMVSVINITVNKTTSIYTVYESCKAIIQCDTVSIIGDSSLCYKVPVIYKARRNTGCTNPVKWILPQSDFDYEQLNDSTISVQYLKTGIYTLIAELTTPCQTLRDILKISVSFNDLSPLSLGSDTSLCPSNTIQLNAHSGYASYKWQDGKTDSTYNVTVPGKYYVTVNDACGGVYSDTINITSAPPVSLSLGPDRTKCNNDTLILHAPYGFLNYSWSPIYNIYATLGPDIIIYPSVDTVYYIKAEKTPGCFGFDTIRIKVKTSPVIFLGRDTSFCSGDSIILNAGTGFSGYLWNGNEGTEKFTAKQQGDYIIKAITVQGCVSSDTLKVINVFANPVVQLDHDTALCIGTSKTLDAGNFSYYAWNTGSNSRTITINDIGFYAVRVTDNNGCKGTDTSYIKQFLPLPSNFLSTDTTICSYGDLTLESLKNYNDYLWNNNAHSSSIKITKPGIYWLQVIDKNNCIGKDSIIVSLKDCMLGFYIPTAFTPNKDGHNDIFRPLVFGNIKQYSFSVYNRWGELIFKSNVPGEGWDGAIKGIDEKTGIYAWTCTYQLEGKQTISKKGTVTLIR